MVGTGRQCAGIPSKGRPFKGIACIGLAMMDFGVRQFAMQCQALRDKIERAGPQSAYPEETACLNKMLIAIHPVQKDLLRQEVQNLPIIASEKQYLLASVDVLKEGGSANFQDWTSVTCVLTNSTVQSWMAEENPDAKLHSMLIFLWNLGLRNPSCPTFQVMTAIICMLTSKQNAPVEEKKHLYDHVKHQWRLISGGMARAAPSQQIGNMPETRTALARFVTDAWWREMMSKPFHELQWVTVHNGQWPALVRSIPMRSTRLDIRDTFLVHRPHTFAALAPGVGMASVAGSSGVGMVPVAGSAPGMAPVLGQVAAMLQAAMQSLQGPALRGSALALPAPDMSLTGPAAGGTLPGPRLSAARGIDAGEARAAGGITLRTLSTTANEALAAENGMTLQSTAQDLLDHAEAVAGKGKGGKQAKGKSKAKAKGKAKAQPKAKSVAKAKGKAKAMPTAMPAREQEGFKIRAYWPLGGH